MIEAAGQASVGKLGSTPKVKDVKAVIGNHSVPCANGEPLDIKGKCELEIFLGG